MRRLILSVPALVLAAGCSSSSPPAGAPTPPAAFTSAAATTSKAPLKAGDTAALVGKTAGVKLDVTYRKVIDPATSNDGFSGPTDGKRFVSVEFRLHNAGTVPYTDDPDNWVWGFNAAGKQIVGTMLFKIVGGEKLDTYMNLAPGAATSGFETFEIPIGQKLAKVQYRLKAGLPSGGMGEWSVG